MPSGRQLVPVPVDDVDAGVVHQDVEPAERGPDERADRLHLLRVGQLGRLHEGLAALLADARGDALQLLRRAAGEHGGGALVGQRERSGLADAAAGAGDPGDLSREPRHRSLLLVASLRARH